MTAYRAAEAARVLLIRHTTAPAPESCRWCGVPEREHCQTWVPGQGWHGWTEPTREQIIARMRARLTPTEATR